MTCIHIIDDDKVSLELVKVLLEGLDFDIRCYGSALEFLENVTQETRGCVLTDMIMPGMSGIELQRELLALKIEIPIIIMSAHGDIRSARDAFKSGAVDFIEKPLSASELIEAVNEATRVTQDLTDSDLQLKEIAPNESLTPKELKIFEYLKAGKSNKEIANKLHLSVRTVETHRAHILRKYDVHSLHKLLGALNV